MPSEMSQPPLLDHTAPAGPAESRYALLINPFYPKDPNASFGKHVLTPTLALTSFAATTPEHWRLQYWDENLLDGRPPYHPMPTLVGISVHLTFAQRAYELAEWYRQRGSKVVLGGLHVLSCPEECAPHADALALGDGVQLWPRILADMEHGHLQSRYVATFDNDYRGDPAPRRTILPRRSFLTTTSLIATRGCHNRCGFCYLATDGLRMPYRMRDPAQIAAEFEDGGQPYGVFIEMEAEGRLLHRDWSLYDTAHAVFRPKHMSPEELEQGYEWTYARLFSHASIWHRRPEDWRAVAPYLAMSYLYKRSNRFWHLLIKHDLVHSVWRPLVEPTRLRHLRFRRQLARGAAFKASPGNVITAGV